MAIAEERTSMPAAKNPNLSPGKHGESHIVSQTSSSHPKEEPPSLLVPLNAPASPKDAIIAVATRVAAQPLPCSDPHVWGVLTAISDKARKRSQGINILLTADLHIIGRLVEDVRFQVESTAVSQRHVEISRRRVPKEDVESPSGFCNNTFLKDTSTNGTYLNWERLKRGSSKFEAKLSHGDIISFAAPPQHDLAFAFVYREVLSSIPSSDAAILKRKAEECTPENKRFKGIGIGDPEGPVSLDDFRSLQRSNAELRKQLENQLLTIDTLRNENREALELHQNEIKELRDSISKPYLNKLDTLRESLETTKKDLTEVSKTSAEQKHIIEDLNVRIAAAFQSCTEANEIIKSQKASIAELKTQFDEERYQRKEEREKADADLKASIQRVQSEGQEELKRVSDASLRREREQQEVINKLHESEKESSLLVESLRSKLEETREKLVVGDNKIRQLEAQVLEEQQASDSRKKRVEELEKGIRMMSRELDQQKAAREEAWAKASALELEIQAAVRELELERRRLKSAREKLMLRETQLRAFYSTTEEINLLFSKQQEQLKAMQRTLEDEENYGVSENIFDETEHIEPACYKSKANPRASVPRFDPDGAETASEEGSATEKHECVAITQDDDNTQEAQFPNDDCVVKCGFGSDIDGVGTAPIRPDDAGGTERVHDTESPDFADERNMDLTKPNNLDGDTLQLESEPNVQEAEQNIKEKVSEGTELGLIRTEDLLASEPIGSWAVDTGPSAYGDNESPRIDMRESDAIMHDFKGTKIHTDVERQALSNMIGILAPDAKEQFGNVGKNAQVGNTEVSDSETDDECVEASKEEVAANDESGSDDETQVEKDEDNGDKMEDDDTMEDSVG